MSVWGGTSSEQSWTTKSLSHRSISRLPVPFSDPDSRGHCSEIRRIIYIGKIKAFWNLNATCIAQRFLAQRLWDLFGGERWWAPIPRRREMYYTNLNHQFDNLNLKFYPLTAPPNFWIFRNLRFWRLTLFWNNYNTISTNYCIYCICNRLIILTRKKSHLKEMGWWCEKKKRIIRWTKVEMMWCCTKMWLSVRVNNKNVRCVKIFDAK